MSDLSGVFKDVEESVAHNPKVLYAVSGDHVIPADRLASDHTVTKHSVVQPHGAAPTTLAASAMSAPFSFRIGPSECLGQLDQVLLRVNAVQSSGGDAAILGGRLVGSIEWKLHGYSLAGTAVGGDVMQFYVLYDKTEADLVLLDKTCGYNSDRSAATFTTAAAADLMIDISGPLAAIRPYIGAMKGAAPLDITVRLNSVADCTTTAITWTLSSVEAHLFWTYDPHPEAHAQAYDASLTIPYLSPWQSSLFALTSGVVTKQRLSCPSGHAAFAILMCNDDSADINAVADAYSGLTSMGMYNSSGGRILSDTDAVMTAAEMKWVKARHFGDSHVMASTTKNWLFYPLGVTVMTPDAREGGAIAALKHGAFTGSYALSGGETVSMTSSDSNADGLTVVIWYYKQLRIRGGYAVAVEDV